MIGALIERVVRGPHPPSGVVYTPRPSIRCRLGLHLWVEIWEGTTTEQWTDGLGNTGGTISFNLNRPPDYESCARCYVMRHRVRAPKVES